MTSPQPQSIPFAAQAVPFADLLASGKMPEGLLTGLSEQEIRDFFAYLRIPQPITR